MVLAPGGRAPAAGHRLPQVPRDRVPERVDILDVWFDSGCSHAAVLETRPELRWPAEMYLEGSDQHRGWFNSSLLEAVGTRDAPPYRSVVTHGFLVDGDGRKMSKSGGNNVTPTSCIPKYGADVLRLWVAAEDYTEDIRLSTEILNRLADAYRRIRNTWRFLLGTLADFDPDRDRVSYDAMDELDRWALLRLGELIARSRRAYEEYQYHVVFHATHNFCAVDLSALYLDIIKDRLYASAPDDPRRRAAQTVCFEVLTALTRLLAPILSFTTDEVWAQIPGAGKPEQRPRRPRSRKSAGSGPTSAWPASGSGCWRCGARSRARSKPRARPGALARASTRCSSWSVRRRSSGCRCWSPRARRSLPPCSTSPGFGCARPAGGRGHFYESADIPGLVTRGGARAGAGLEEVRALLDVEPAGGRGPRASHALRALRAGGARAPLDGAHRRACGRDLRRGPVTKLFALGHLRAGCRCRWWTASSP